MSNQIIGNTEYNSIKEKAYINGTQENIMQLAAELDKVGINYSGRVSDYRSAITVEDADRARTLEILKTILNADKENTPVENSDKNIIGNAEYRYIPNKRYVRGEAEAMLRTADRLTAENISFSGRIKGDTVTLTVSGEETQELVKKYFAEEKNRIENIQSAYFLALSSDTFEDGYYFSEVNTSTGEEIAPYRGKFCDISMFLTVDEAEQYARVTGITLSNTDEQLNEWRRIEIEAEKEKDRQLNLSRSREIIKRLPVTDSGYEEHFVLRDEAVDWIYFNPDGADGEGQFVQTTLYADDLIAAYNARSNTDDYRKFGQSVFIETIQNGSQTVINADTVDFEFLADTFIKSRGNENVIVSAPIVSGNGYDNNFERIIDLLENHFEDVRSYKENHITETSDKISVEGHIGTWYVIDSEEIEGRKLFLLEHERYGDEAANIIIDENKNLVMEDVYNGFDDYRDSLIYADDKQFISRDFAVELWENGFTVFMNDRNNALSDKSDDPSLFELFTEEKNNTFYAFNKDIVQQRLLDDTVTLLDELNDASMREASHTENAIDTIDDYAKEMSEDGECAYKWSDGLTEWQNISASIRSGNSEYIYSWLRDLRSVLPSLEENQGVSVETALNYLDNYEKQYMNKLSPLEKYVPDENLPLSKQLYEIAKIELTNYENSLDTAEKAKAAAYELSVKRDILSYIEYDLSEDITDSDVENACRRLISTGYPLDTFYQDWLKNEYDNRMEAIKMTAEDTFRNEDVLNKIKENAAEKVYISLGAIEKAREAAHNAGLPFREAFADNESEEDFNPYAFDGTMSPEEEKIFTEFKENNPISVLNNEEIMGADIFHDRKERQVHNAFQRLKDNHDFSPEVTTLLDRVEKHIIRYDEENFSSKIFGLSLFEQTYGRVSRVNEKLFGGELRSVIDEVNGYIFEEKNPNKKLLSENDLSALREIKAEHDRSNAEETETENSPMGNNAALENEKVLKAVTNQYNGFLIVQDVVYALQDLQNGTDENYDWKNYSEAFKKVLDSNIHTDVAIPLYKSEADKILSDAADGKVISADDIAKALSNLELVLQNSHLLKNPEEKVEQISFFDNAPSRKSSDEIGFYSSAPEAPQNVTSPVGNNEALKNEKSFAEQVDDVLSGNFSRYNDLKVCDTPKILLDVGCEQLPMLYTQQHLKKAIMPKDLKEHQHGLSVDVIKRVPEMLLNPVMVLDSLSRNDSIVVVLSSLETDIDNNPIIATVRPNGNGTYELNAVDSNFITSIYGRENFAKFINNSIKNDKVLFYDNRKSQELFSVLGLQFPKGLNNLDSDIIIHQSKNIVNTQKQKNIDYTITDKNYGTEGGAKTRFANNVEAIKLLKAIESENRPAAPEEQEVLAKYVGWGGIPEAFDSSKENWKKEYTELKNLLTDEEYRAARASTMNAHYTSPTVINAVYSGLENLGFKGGKILEPAMGIGNFFGAMPESLHNNSELHGVELDSITGRIAQQLYPSADIQIKGYENTDFTNGSFDVAVGNVPFGSYKVNDKDYNKQNLFIHDYFFAKTLDKVRAGGIVAFVTSKGTLDKENPEVRKYLAERAELLGAIRLPNNAFKANAGTEVTSDIIFLQKRENPISIEENPPEWVYKDMLPNGIAVNKYFADHPEMILGEMVEGNKLYGNQTDASMCVPIEGADLSEQLAAAVKNITGAYKAAEKGIADVSPLENLGETPCPPNAPKFSYIVQDDILYYRKADITMEKVNAPENVVERIKAMVQLRDTVHSLLELQLDNTDGSLDIEISEAQAALNKQYDDFSEKYGLISSAENKSFFKNDNSYHLIKALEKLDKDGNFIRKADIFSKITVNPKTVVDHCDNAQDALILSLSEKMCVNLDYMSILTGKSEEELIDELGDKIFQNPQKHMRWESADEYLTGNIRQKLAAAEAEGLTRNAEALRTVMPKRIEAADIVVKLGSAWVDPDYIRQFIVETLQPDFITSKNIEVTYMPATDKWKVEGWRSAYENTLASETYGTQDIKAYEIIEATLNMQKVEIRQRVKGENGDYIRDSKGRYVYEVNQKKTMIAQAKQDELKRKFSDWIFSDPDRREKLVDVYNEKFNSVRLREYDGSHLNFVGMNSAITLKEHQKNAVARGLYSNGNTLLAHEVGAGKTYEMIAIAMEGKRLGLHHKSLITAPNGLTEQWGNAFRTLYPNANVLVATEKDFQKENRRDLFAKITTGDWDAVIIGHSQFDMIHLSRERELDGLYSEVARLEAALDEMLDDNGKKSFSVKQIEKSIKTYEDKIQKLLDKTPEDDMLCFEKLGVDKIFVDESQAYKNLDTPTKMRNVSGIGSGGSGRSMQLLMKCKYLDEITGGRGVTFASGTPISNSMSEMYTLMRYLQADKLAETGINSFDRWASVFGETTTSMELSPEGNGKYQMKTRFAKFQNLPELMNIFKECADIKTAESLDLDRPDFEMHNVNVPATAMQATMIKELGERAKDIRAGAVKPTEDNMCKLTVDGRKIGLDQRCMNPNLPDDPKSKVNVCINNVFDIWQRTAEEKSTQLIFCDLATPQPTLNENMYTVYRKNPHGIYNDVYSAKLGEKDTAEKIMKKLNGKKPPKNYEAGEIANGDIIMLKRVNYEEETAYNTAFEMRDGKLTEISPGTWEKLRHSPTEHFESERRFCVYDDIKQKLVAKGVPEKEIAFIHDAEKAEDKQKLYDKMNKGEIRVLIGSTQKCGAGMNAQERMIALHDLDAPMRPSDMEQRHGRIIRQGNTNSKVDIYRYTTDKTFDAYLYQLLENKQRFISQIMTDKSPVRSCEDVDEVALDYAEVKALCAGNPLIREKIDLETEITKLNVLKSAFLSQKYSLQDKAYKTLPEHRKYTEHYVEKLKADIEAVKSVKPLTNEDGKNYYPVTVNGKEYHDKEEAGQAIRTAIDQNSDIRVFGNTEHIIGSYRGLEMRAFWDTNWGLAKMKVNLKGACDHCGEINMNIDVKASGNIVRLDNVINGIELELQKQEDRLQSLTADIKEAEIAAEAEFPQEKELIEKEKRLAEVDTLLTSSEVRIDNSMELYAALVEICPELESYDTLYCKYEKGEDSGIEPLIVEKDGDTVFIAHTYVQNSNLMYDPAIEFSFDTENHRAEALSYELSGMGIYEDFRDGDRPDKKADVEEMALDTMFENIKAYDYERTQFNVEDNREAEKEKGEDFER